MNLSKEEPYIFGERQLYRLEWALWSSLLHKVSMPIALSVFSWTLGECSKDKGIAFVSLVPSERQVHLCLKADLFSSGSIIESQVVMTVSICGVLPFEGNGKLMYCTVANKK